MVRPRRPFNGVEEISQGPEPFLTGVASGALGVRQRNRWDASTHWTYRQANGQFDPLTYLHLLDEVCGIDPDIELRSARLAEWLNESRSQFIWDPVTVGKVLSDLCDAFEGKLGVKMGLLERGRDYRGSFYRVHHVASVAALYHLLREELMALVEIEFSSRANRLPHQRLASPLLECPSVREDWSNDEA